ncbi:hypothetical protein ACJX0J_040312, partial [Zea mays]
IGGENIVPLPEKDEVVVTGKEQGDIKDIPSAGTHSLQGMTPDCQMGNRLEKVEDEAMYTAFGSPCESLSEKVMKMMTFYIAFLIAKKLTLLGYLLAQKDCEDESTKIAFGNLRSEQGGFLIFSFNE